MITCLDIYLDNISNASTNKDIYLKIYVNRILTNGKIVYAISKFHSYVRFSDITIAMGDIDYLTDNELCYDKVSFYKKYFFTILILNENILINKNTI